MKAGAALIVMLMGLACASHINFTSENFQYGTFNGTVVSRGNLSLLVEHRIQIVISNVGDEVRNHQIEIILNSSNFDYSSSTDDGRDVWFSSDEKGENIIPHYIEDWNVSGDSIVWVNVPTIPSGTSVYMWFGNVTRRSRSNGTETFVFYDGFETSENLSEKWEIVGNWSIVEDGGRTVLRKSEMGTGYAMVKNLSIRNFLARWKWKFFNDSQSGLVYRAGNSSPFFGWRLMYVNGEMISRIYTEQGLQNESLFFYTPPPTYQKVTAKIYEDYHSLMLGGLSGNRSSSENNASGWIGFQGGYNNSYFDDFMVANYTPNVSISKTDRYCFPYSGEYISPAIDFGTNYTLISNFTSVYAKGDPKQGVTFYIMVANQSDGAWVELGDVSEAQIGMVGRYVKWMVKMNNGETRCRSPSIFSVSIEYAVGNPIIEIASPSNIVSTPFKLRWSVKDNVSLSSIWYSVDGGSNITLRSDAGKLSDCGEESINLAEGEHEIVIYAQDVLGAISSKKVSFRVAVPSGVGGGVAAPIPTAVEITPTPTVEKTGEVGNVVHVPGGERRKLDVGNVILSIEIHALKDITVFVRTEESDWAEEGKYLDAIPYKFINITSNLTRGDANVTIRFRVEKDWILEQGIAPSTIGMYRYDGGWILLPTALAAEDERYVYFNSTADSLSVFAIAGKRIEMTPTPTISAPSPPEFSPAILVTVLAILVAALIAYKVIRS